MSWSEKWKKTCPDSIRPLGKTGAAAAPAMAYPHPLPVPPLECFRTSGPARHLRLKLEDPVMGPHAGVDDVCCNSSYYSGFPVEVLNWTSYLVLRGVHCRLCSKAYRSGDWIKKLPCRHVFHCECIESWFHSGYSVCPAGSCAVYDVARDPPRHLTNANDEGPAMGFGTRASLQQQQGGTLAAGTMRLKPKAATTKQLSNGCSHANGGSSNRVKDSDGLVDIAISGQGISKLGQESRSLAAPAAKGNDSNRNKKLVDVACDQSQLQLGKAANTKADSINSSSIKESDGCAGSLPAISFSVKPKTTPRTRTGSKWRIGKVKPIRAAPPSYNSSTAGTPQGPGGKGASKSGLTVPQLTQLLKLSSVQTAPPIAKHPSLMQKTQASRMSRRNLIENNKKLLQKRQENNHNATPRGSQPNNTTPRGSTAQTNKEEGTTSGSCQLAPICKKYHSAESKGLKKAAATSKEKTVKSSTAKLPAIKPPMLTQTHHAASAVATGQGKLFRGPSLPGKPGEKLDTCAHEEEGGQENVGNGIGSATGAATGQGAGGASVEGTLRVTSVKLLPSIIPGSAHHQQHHHQRFYYCTGGAKQ